MNSHGRRRTAAAGRWRMVGAAAALGLVLGGCSGIGDWLPGSGFPKLGATPARPEVGEPAGRRAVAQSLAADRAMARYTDDVLRGRQPAPVMPRGPATPIGDVAAPASELRSPLASAMPEPMPPVVAAPRDTVSVTPARTAVRQLGTIRFDSGNASLSIADKDMLEEVARAQRARGGVLRVVGHASDVAAGRPMVEQRMASLDLSQRRAEAVAAELMRHGVDASAIRIEAMGNARPIPGRTGPAATEYNRRAEIFLEN